MSTKDVIEIPSVYLKGMLSSIYANDKVGLKVITNSFVQKTIKDAEIAFIIGKFVPSKNSAKAPQKSRKYVLESMKTRGIDETTTTKVEQTTDELSFYIKNGYSGATVKILNVDEQIRLVYSQFGHANVLVYRPMEGLIFPDPQLFIDGTDDEYTAWENINPLMITEKFQVGDMLMIFIPLNEDAVEDLSPAWLIEIFEIFHLTGDFGYLDEEIFFSIHRITSLG